MRDPLPAPEDILRLTRLLHELCEIGTDTYAWRNHLQTVMEPMLEAPISVSYTFRFSLDVNEIGPKVLVYNERGLNEFWKSYFRRGDLSGDPVTPEIMKRYRTDFTVTRDELVDDATWYNSSYYREVRIPSDMDEAVYSQVAVNDPEVVDGLSFARRVGMPRFTRREATLVRFVHHELARLWNRPDPVGTHLLPARQREVLAGIRRGDTRKAIAQKMQVSVHTVHSYEKAIFQRAGVTSRGELLASLSGVIRPSLLP